jgi:hypothetical protein
MFKRTMIFAAVLGTLTLLGGCEKALFPETAQRTPYDRYQMLRGQGRASTETDKFGNNEPALRDRLRPLDEQ